MSQHAVFCEFNGQRTRLGTATQAEDGSFVVVLGGFLVIGKAEAGQQPATTRPTSSGGAPASGMTFPPFGRSKGLPIHGADMESLEWYGRAIQQSVDDPSKARWRDRNQQVLDAINAEIIRQGGGSHGYGAPQPDGIGGDRFGQTEQDDIPFSGPSGASMALA